MSKFSSTYLLLLAFGIFLALIGFDHGSQYFIGLAGGMGVAKIVEAK